MFKPRCISNARYNFFTEGVIDIWYNLQSSVNFASLTTFKQAIAGFDLYKYIKSSIVDFLFFYFCIFHIFMGG